MEYKRKGVGFKEGRVAEGIKGGGGQGRRIKTRARLAQKATVLNTIVDIYG